MLNYLRNTLGLTAQEYEWEDESKLPRYLRGRRSFSVLQIQGIKLLVIRVSEDSFSVQAFIKQQEKLSAYWQDEIVLCFDRLSSYQRKALIKQHLAFIVPNVQLYIPFLGMLLQEKKMPAPPVVQDHFSASAQYVFLFILYHAREFPMTKSELARRLSINVMTATRAVRDLEQIGLIRCKRNGRADDIIPSCSGKELYEKAKSYLINPVVKKVFIRKNGLPEDAPVAGLQALSSISMLSEPRIPIRALAKKMADHYPLQQMDPDWETDTDYIELELWAYDPYGFAQNQHVDIASLCASLQNETDERVEEAIEESLEEYAW